MEDRIGKFQGGRDDDLSCVAPDFDALSPSDGLPLTVVMAGNATSGSDFDAISATFSVLGNVQTVSLPVTIRDDNESAGNETNEMTISAGMGFSRDSGWSIGSMSVHTLTIEDDDLTMGFAAAGTRQ